MNSSESLPRKIQRVFRNTSESKVRLLSELSVKEREREEWPLVLGRNSNFQTVHIRAWTSEKKSAWPEGVRAVGTPPVPPLPLLRLRIGNILLFTVLHYHKLWAPVVRLDRPVQPNRRFCLYLYSNIYSDVASCVAGHEKIAFSSFLLFSSS